MIANLIRWSLQNRLLILLLSLLLAGWGMHALRNTPVDAIPDLSDVQVIIKTSFPGQAPRVVESQVTYPITTAMLAVPGATAVRGYSYFGDSYIYVLFEDGTDLYWARARVLEYLNQAIADMGGKLLPFNWLKLLWRVKVKLPDTARVPLMGVRRSYHNTPLGPGIAMAVISAVQEAAIRRGLGMVETSWILEDNAGMRSIMELIGGTISKRYRMFEKAL